MPRENELIIKSRITRVGIAFLSITLIFAFLYSLRATEQTGAAISFAAQVKTGQDLFYAPHLLYMTIIQACYLVFSNLFNYDIIGSGQIHSIIWAIVTLISLYLLLRRLIGSVFGAFLAALFTLVSHDFWVYSTQLEVYVPVMGCLTLLTAILYLRCTTSCSMSHLIMLSGLWALSVFYHQANVIFIIPLGYYMISTQGKKGWSQLGIISVLSGTVVLSGYIIAFWSTYPGKTIKEFVKWTIALAQVPMTDWGTFVPWNTKVIKFVIISQFSVFEVLPEYFSNLWPFYKFGILIIAFILLWNTVQYFRRVPEYNVRAFFLIWYVVYFLFFLRWDPRVHKFFIPTVIPLIVLGSAMLHDVLAPSRISKLIKIPAIGFICCFIIATFMCNLFSSILPIRNSLGAPYYEAATLNILSPKNCVIYSYGHNLETLVYYFDRSYSNRVSVRDLYTKFYNAATPQGIRNDRPFQNEGCTLISLAFLSPKFYNYKTNGYLNSVKWSDFIKWFFDVQYQSKDGSVTYNPFTEVSHKDGPSYILIDRSRRDKADSVEELFQKIEIYIDKNKEKFGPRWQAAPSVLLKNAKIKHSQRLIFGHGVNKP